jgi:hypothetical protein
MSWCWFGVLELYICSILLLPGNLVEWRNKEGADYKNTIPLRIEWYQSEYQLSGLSGLPSSRYVRWRLNSPLKETKNSVFLIYIMYTVTDMSRVNTGSITISTERTASYTGDYVADAEKAHLEACLILKVSVLTSLLQKDKETLQLVTYSTKKEKLWPKRLVLDYISSLSIRFMSIQ